MSRIRIGGFAARTAAVFAVAPLLVGLTAAESFASTPSQSAVTTKAVPYLGHVFTVPASWPVVNLAQHPGTCVRYDEHAVYLGTPSADQKCPSNVMGHTDTILIEPAAKTTKSAVAENAVEQRLTATAPGIEVTASYGAAGAAEVTGILTSAGLVTTAPTVKALTTTRPAVTAATTSVALSTTNYTGEAFDPCAAPSSSTMSAWKGTSPYGAIGVYIGGADVGCSQPNLTSSWVSTEASAGWHFFTLYVGPQAPGSSCTSCTTITSATSQADSAAEDAVTNAENLGFGPGTPILYDMESFSSSGESTALSFLSEWTNKLHALGYDSGVYSSESTGITDLIDNINSYTMPDVIDFANWNGTNSTSDSGIPSGDWINHQRIHQFAGNVSQTYGGVNLSVDQNAMDVAASASSSSVYPDGSGGRVAAGVHEDGRVEVFTVTPSGGIDNKYETSADGAWSGFNGFGPSGTAVAVAVGRHADGRLEVFAVMSDGSMENKYETTADGNWSGWNGYAPAGTAATATVGVHSDGRLEVFAVTPSGGIENKYETTADGSWSGWNAFGPSGTVKSVTAARHADGRLEVFASLSDGSMQNKYETTADGSWSGWNSYAAASTVKATGEPGVVGAGVHEDGRIEVFAVTPSGGIENKYETTADGAWSGFNGFGPSGTVEAVATARHADGRLEVFAIMSDGSMENKYESAADGSWSGWNSYAAAGTAHA